MEKSIFNMNYFNKYSIKVKFIICLFLSLIIFFLDSVTEVNLDISVFYALPIVIITWYGNRLSGILLAIIGSILWCFSDITAHHSYDQIYLTIWSTLIKLIFFSGAVFPLHIIKTIIIREHKLADSKSELLGIAAHDLRNPINSIYLYTSYFLKTYDKVLTVNQSDMLQKVSQLCIFMSGLIDDVLFMSKIDSGKINLIHTSNNYLDLINNIIELNTLIAENKQITLEFHSDKDNITLTYDKNKIEQVLNNFISNAIKFSYPNTKVSINIEITDNFVKTSIIDQGIGIRPDEQHLVFQPFAKISNKPTSGEKSTGLGLSISKKIVEAHNGTVGFQSEVNTGSTFYFTLPLNN